MVLQARCRNLGPHLSWLSSRRQVRGDLDGLHDEAQGIGVRIGRKLSGLDSVERSDIVVTNGTQTATIVDFTVSFEGEEDKLENSRSGKVANYRERQAGLEAMGYETALDAMVAWNLALRNRSGNESTRDRFCLRRQNEKADNGGDNRMVERHLLFPHLRQTSR